MVNDKFYIELKNLTDLALSENEVPIASIVVEDDKIIGRGFNKVEKTQNFMNHAEILAISEAMEYKKNWRLDNCILYTTLEPCSMCKEIIKKSRIKKVIYLSKQNENKCDNEKIEYIFEDSQFFSNILKDFFKNIRK